MSRRLLLAVAVFGLLAIAGWRDPARGRFFKADPKEEGSSSNVGAATLPVAAPAPLVPPAAGEPRSMLAERLNAPNGTIQADLKILQEILVAWRSNLPHAGNPVGENTEITAVLAGANSLQLALIPNDHPAINSAGALCDRWGTPFRFHQVSGMQMEIRSAGPDRKFGTVDDAQF